MRPLLRDLLRPREKYGCGSLAAPWVRLRPVYGDLEHRVLPSSTTTVRATTPSLPRRTLTPAWVLERLSRSSASDVNSLFDVDTVMNITHKVSEITGAHYGETNAKRRVSPHHHRPHPLLDLYDLRRRSPLQRGPRLCAAPSAPPRRPPRTSAGEKEPFLYKVCDTVIHENRGAYPELTERQEYITGVIRSEEENFSRTIDGGMAISPACSPPTRKKGETVFSGADAFKLYDTYGFPLDLTKEMAADEGMTVDEPAFQTLMKEQRERAAPPAPDETAWAGLDLGLDNLPTKFTGYERLHDDCTILAIVAEDDPSASAPACTRASFLTKHRFYAEMGGQSADHGLLILGDAVF